MRKKTVRQSTGLNHIPRLAIQKDQIPQLYMLYMFKIGQITLIALHLITYHTLYTALLPIATSVYKYIYMFVYT